MFCNKYQMLIDLNNTLTRPVGNHFDITEQLKLTLVGRDHLILMI